FSRDITHHMGIFFRLYAPFLNPPIGIMHMGLRKLPSVDGSDGFSLAHPAGMSTLATDRLRPAVVARGERCRQVCATPRAGARGGGAARRRARPAEAATWPASGGVPRPSARGSGPPPAVGRAAAGGS